MKEGFSVFELVVAPLVFALALRHASRALGVGRAAGELLALFLFAFALEQAGVVALGSPVYGPAHAFRGIPVAVPLLWSALSLSGLALASRHSCHSPLGRACGAALLGLTLDLALEPVAAADGLWRFSPAGSWLGVPVGAPVLRAVALGLYLYGGEAVSLGSGAGSALRRLLAALLALAGPVGAAFLARGLELEAHMPASMGWGLWSAAVLATMALGWRRGGWAVGTSLGSRLGAVPGHGPGLSYLLAAAAIATQGALQEAPLVRLAVAGPALALLVVAGGDVHDAALSAWRERVHGRLRGAEGLVAVLMKRRNGRPWTREERAFLRQGLRAAARYLPALLLFLLPGSVVLLPAYAWLLDRRRGARLGEGARRAVAGPSVEPTPPRRGGRRLST